MVVPVAIAMLLGQSPCPSRAAVEERLIRSTPVELRRQHAWVSVVEGDSLRLTLKDARGEVVRERVVPAKGSCDEKEKIAAAVIAAWMMAPPEIPAAPRVAKGAAVRGSVRDEVPPAVAEAPASVPSTPLRSAQDDVVTPAIPERVSPPPSVPSTPALRASAQDDVVTSPAPPTSAQRDAETPARVANDEVPGAATGVTRDYQPPAPATPIRFELGVDGRAQFAGTFAPGLGLTLAGGSAFSGFLEVSGAFPRVQPLDTGQVRWLRIALGAGARYRADLRHVYLEPALSVEGAWVRVSGENFSTNSTASGFDFSACAQLRLGHQFGDTLGVFLGARGCSWPLPNRIGVQGVDQTLAMPRWEATALVGISAGYALKGSSDSEPSAQ